jgi:hypothetical protein
VPSGRDIGYASSGLSFGRSGTVGIDGYLLNGVIPSNLTGIKTPVYNALLSKISVSGHYGSTYTCTLAIEKRIAGTLTEIATISLTAEREKIEPVSIPLSYGEELAVKVKSGNIADPNVNLIVEGDGTP